MDAFGFPRLVSRFLDNDPFAELGAYRPRWISGIVGGGRPSRYAESPNLWNTLFEKLGLDAVFLAFDLAKVENLTEFIEAFLELPGALDLTVTNPFKAAACDALARLRLPAGLRIEASERVEAIGCLNHLIVDRAGCRLIAENTDGIGMRRALEESGPLDGRSALLVGAGGAAAAIGWELLAAGAYLTIANIVEADARALAGRLARPDGQPIQAGGWELIAAAAAGSDIIVSAISAGSPLDVAAIVGLPPQTLLADARYGQAAEFALAAIQAGRRLGRQIIDGRAMLFGQFEAAAALARPIAGISIQSLEQALDGLKRGFQ